MLKCKRCDNEWLQKFDRLPKRCPECDSPYWQKELSEYWQAQKEKREAAKLALLEKEGRG